MGKHRLIIAATFGACGLVIGVPSFIVLAGLVAADITYHPLPAVEGGHNLDIGTYGLVALLVDGARGVAAAFGFAISAMDWVIKAVAVAALIFGLLGTILYVVGRGLRRRALWARVLAACVVIACLMFTLAALSIMPHNSLIFGWLISGMFAYSLWALVFKFD